jgi:hypothetical protein
LESVSVGNKEPVPVGSKAQIDSAFQGLLFTHDAVVEKIMHNIHDVKKTSDGYYTGNSVSYFLYKLLILLWSVPCTAQESLKFQLDSISFSIGPKAWMDINKNHECVAPVLGWDEIKGMILLYCGVQSLIHFRHCTWCSIFVG